MLRLTNYLQNEIVPCPLIIVKGTSTAPGIVLVIHHGLHSNRFPTQYFPIDNGHFVALVHLEAGENTVAFQQVNGEVITTQGDGGVAIAATANNYQTNPVVTLKVHYVAPLLNKPIHLCMIAARDSPLLFDNPGYKANRNDLATAIRKLKIGGRLMQAYTLEEMRRNGFGNRTFEFASEWTTTSLLKQDIDGHGNGRGHHDIKVHVITSRKTLKEIRDPNWAQQNAKGTNTGALFGHALEELEHYGGPFGESHATAQAAVMYLDSTWDQKLQLILAHAALGGGTSRISLAIFGSQGLHSWPSYVEDILPAFQDDTRLSIKEVANDCNECGTAWETFTLSMGAFMHEIGHSLGSPHQTSGVMLRDYTFLQRSFCTREAYCERTKTPASLIPSTGTWPRECHWHRLDLIRYLHHGSLGLPTDAYDVTFEKRLATLGNGAKKRGVYPHVGAPMGFITPAGCYVKASSGIYLVELVLQDLARAWIEYLPETVGGPGQQHEMILDPQELKARLPREFQGKPFHVRVLSVSGDLNIDDFEKYCQDGAVKVAGGVGYKSARLGNATEKEVQVEVDMSKVVGARVYHGSSVDGVRFFFPEPARAGAPPLPARNYLHGVMDHLANKMSEVKMAEPLSVLLGNQTPNYTDFMLNPGETIVKLHFRSGAWIDAILFETSTKRRSPFFGGSGGGERTLEAPQGFTITGIYGFMGRWVYGLGIIYA